MNPWLIAALAGLGLWFFGQRSSAAASQAEARRIAALRAEEEASSGGTGFSDWLARGGQAVGAIGTAVGLGSKVLGIFGVGAAEAVAPTAVVAGEAAVLGAGAIAPALPGVAGAALAEASVPTFGAIFAPELGAIVATEAGVVAGEAAVAGGAVAAEAGTAVTTTATTGTVAGAIGWVIAPIAVIFTALMVDKMITERARAKQRARRAGDANDFLASLFGSVSAVTTTEEFETALFIEAHPGTGISLGAALNQAAQFLHHHQLVEAIDTHWSPRYGAISAMLDRLGAPAHNAMTLRDVNSIFEAMMVSSGDLGERNARVRGWLTLMEGVEQVFTSGYTETYADVHALVIEPPLARPPTFTTGEDRAMWWRLVTLGNSAEQAFRQLYGVDVRSWTIPPGMPGSGYFVNQAGVAIRDSSIDGLVLLLPDELFPAYLAAIELQRQNQELSTASD